MQSFRVRLEPFVGQVLVLPLGPLLWSLAVKPLGPRRRMIGSVGADPAGAESLLVGEWRVAFGDQTAESHLTVVQTTIERLTRALAIGENAGS